MWGEIVTSPAVLGVGGKGCRMGVGVLQEVGMRMEISNLRGFKIDDGGIVYMSELILRRNGNRIKMEKCKEKRRNRPCGQGKSNRQVSPASQLTLLSALFKTQERRPGEISRLILT